jgi:hypothetical protein
MKLRRPRSNGASKSKPEESLLDQLGATLRDFLKDFKSPRETRSGAGP